MQRRRAVDARAPEVKGRRVCTHWCTLQVMSKTVPVREFRQQLAELLNEVAERREHVTVTRRGRPAAVLIPVAELEREPEIGHALRGRLKGLHSYRVGAYRIIYESRDASTVRVVAIRHRGHAYGTDPG